MTRESKVAIILGFAVVLVVAALISDHFSHARQAQVGNGLAQGTPEQFGAGSAGLREPIGNTKVVMVKEPLDGNGAGPRTAGKDDSSASDGAGSKSPAGSGKPVEIPMAGPKDGKVNPGEQPSDPVKPDGNSDTPKEPPERAIAGGELPFSEKNASTYQVKENDSLYRIAKASYGDGTLWQELADYNKGKIGANNSLRSGATIVIPPKDVLLGKARLRPEGATPTKETRVAKDIPKRDRDAVNGDQTKKPTADKAAAKDAPKYVMYTVRKGDHLSTIAQRLLGSSRRVGEILKLNPSLDDEDSIREGMALKIPKN